MLVEEINLFLRLIFKDHDVIFRCITLLGQKNIAKLLF